MALNAPKNDIKIFLNLNEGWKDLPLINRFSKVLSIYLILT